MFSSSTNPHHPQPLIKCQFLCWKSKRRLYLTCTHIWTTPFRNIIRMVANHKWNAQPQLQIQFPQSKICHQTIHNHINFLFFRALNILLEMSSLLQNQIFMRYKDLLRNSCELTISTKTLITIDWLDDQRYQETQKTITMAICLKTFRYSLAFHESEGRSCLCLGLFCLI